MPAPQEIRPDDCLSCFALIARYHGCAWDLASLRHALGKPGAAAVQPAELVRLARRLGLRADYGLRTAGQLSELPVPLMSRRKDGRWQVLARVSEAEVLILDPDRPEPATLPRHEFLAHWSGETLLIGPRRARRSDPARFGFGWFVPVLLRYRKHLGEVVVASLFLQLFALVTPLFFQVIIDKVLVHRGLTTLDVLVVGLAVIGVFDALLAYLRAYVFSHTSNRIDTELGASVVRHLLRLPLAYFEARRVGDTVARVRELENIRQFLTGSSVTLLIDLGFTVVFFGALWLYSPQLALIVFATLPVYVLLAAVLTPPLRERLHQKFARGADNHAFLVESVAGIATLKSTAVEALTQRDWEERLAAYVRAGFAVTQLSNLSSQCAALVNKLMVAMILWCGARQVMRGELSVGQLVAFNMIAARISQPILRLVQLWQDFQQAGISVARLGDVLNAPTERSPAAAAPPAIRIRGAIRLDGVSFRYRSEAPEVLRHIDLATAPGEVIGIVGRSGSGKSTLTKLVQRLYTPQRGRVLIDDLDLALVDVAWLRRQMGVVSQDATLFNRSVRENIALAEPAAPMQRVVNAARLAGAHDFVVDLPQSYETVIGEHGAALSGGQRQRLALARALLTNPRILILDEATSALDYESEAIVLRHMRQICKGRTVLIVAHRLSAIRAADRIVVLDDGRIVESGTHRELLNRGDYYARLYRHQVSLAAVAG